MRRQNAAIGNRPLAFLRFQHERASTITKENAGGAILPIENARKGFRTDDQRTLGKACAQMRIGSRHGIDKAGAHGLHIECITVGHAQAVLDVDGRGRKRVVRRRGGDDDEIDIGGCQTGIVECCTCRLLAE